MKPPKTKEIQKLLRKAAEDEVLLDKHLDDHDISDAIWGFHAQQAIEKLLKAVLVCCGVEFPKTHDLSTLYEFLKSTPLAVPFSEDDLETLTPYAVILRYDDEVASELGRHEIRSLIKRIRNWVEKTTKES